MKFFSSRKHLILFVFLILTAFFLNAEETFLKPNIIAQASKNDPPPVDDRLLIQRILNAYRKSHVENLGNSMWQSFFLEKHQSIHKTFLKGNVNKAAPIFRNPGGTDFFWGIDSLCSSFLPAILNDTHSYAVCCLEDLMRCGVAIKAIPNQVELTQNWDSMLIVEKIESKLNQKLNFPNPYINDYGAYTPRGVVTYRASQSLYQAWLICQLLKGIENPKVLEIGGGVGRTAYYARLMGIKDYTIIDIPITAAASSYFLGRTLGNEKVAYEGESFQDIKDRVKVLNPKSFLSSNEKYDLIINVDSLTEMDRAVAERYYNHISMVTPLFVSINHEANPFSVREIINKNHYQDYQRKNYFMRDDYFEEVVRFE